MKHETEVASARWLSRYDPRSRGEISFPRARCDFQPPKQGDFFGDSDSPRRRTGSSRGARASLRAEASRSFRLEAAVFGLISLVCLWPIAIMIHEVSRLLK